MSQISSKRILIKNIGSLIQVRDLPVSMVSGADLDKLPSLANAWLLIENGHFKAHGNMESIPEGRFDVEYDATDRLVMPAFVDSHTHLVFAESRESEFVDKIRGMSYAEIAARGGGILNSAEKLGHMNVRDLLTRARERLAQARSYGTGAIEIKSGYGLSLENELKMLQVIALLKEEDKSIIKSTFLGAHAVPRNQTRERYIKEITEEMIPEISRQKLADYIDVFCEEGFFSIEETRAILLKGMEFGLKARIHANQLTNNGGVQLGVELGALSVDHLEQCGDSEILALSRGKTMPTLLPGAAFFLRLPYPPARKMIKAGLPLAIASDFNPGSAPGCNMQMIWSLSCIGMRLTPAEALNAMTINTAATLETNRGSITPGQPADFIITQKMKGIEFIPYSYGNNHIWKLFLGGIESF